MRPHVVVSDILTLAPALAAEKAGVPLATLIPHIYPVVEPGLPFFAIGLQPPRTPARARRSGGPGSGRSNVGLEHGRRDLNRQRERLGLPPVERFHGGISPDLALVATYPQLEYPRRWPAGVEVTGPMTFEVPHPEIELPPGEEPLVLVAPSTAHDSDNHLVRTALAALAEEPVRVVATTNRVVPQRPIEVPANAVLVDWLSYSQLMPAASLVDLPRRPRHRRPRARRRHPGPDLPDHRRHERDRDAGRLGRRRPLAALAPLPPGAAALGGAPPARRPLLRRPRRRARRLGPGARRRRARRRAGRGARPQRREPA